ncbi:Holliday junction branch migration protein RuvA [Acidobacteria bacterium AH-259-D05]|nr:Holliday junction branch migration protein RuvA [Acidobacteria bacterium AH-259-D05]
MIASLKGVLREKSAGRIVIEINGVGYEVLIPFSTYYELGEVGDTVSLRIYTHVKEDAFSLYGFQTTKEKRLFTQLIQVSGIGPKLGVTILSGLPVDEFIQALMDGNVVKLTGIPGVGKKTAERLVLEMKDKVLEWFPEMEEAPAVGSGSLQADVVSALVNLGYPKNTAERAVSTALEEGPEDVFEALLKKSLRKARG